MNLIYFGYLIIRHNDAILSQLITYCYANIYILLRCYYVMIELISFVLSGKIRKQVMFKLTKPTQPNQIAKEINTHLSTTSRAIKELMEKKLIKCLNEHNTNYRLYELTDLGRFVLEEIKKSY